MWRCLVAKSRKTHLPPTETRIPIAILSKQLAVTGVLTRRATPLPARPHPVVAVTGPRQSSKTTLVRSAFAEKPYVSLEDPDVREAALADPRGFLALYPNGAVLDEAQHAAPLFSYLQTQVDEDRHRGRTPDAWVLTGSQHFGLVASITQALAARVGLLQLLPLALGELQAGQHSAAAAPLAELQWRGLYPPVVDRDVPPAVWYADPVVTGSEHAAPARQRARSVALSHLHAPARGALGANGQPDCIGRRLRQRPAAVAAVAIGKKSVNGWSKSAMKPWC